MNSEHDVQHSNVSEIVECIRSEAWRQLDASLLRVDLKIYYCLHTNFLPFLYYSFSFISSAVLMLQNSIGDLALPAVVALISFLAYGPQVLFRHIEPYALGKRQTVIFNVLVACLWITYAQASFTNPGWVSPVLSQDHSTSEYSQSSKRVSRWCRKCEALKPPRAHHCKVCQRWLEAQIPGKCGRDSDGISQVYTEDGSPLPVDY